MLYLIVTLINEPAKSFSENLIKDVSNKFGTTYLSEKNAPGHITLKYGFETGRIDVIEEIIERFCRENRACKYRLNDYAFFGKDTIFINVEPSNEMNLLHKKLVIELKKVDWLTWNSQFDAGRIRFHVSIAHFNPDERIFGKILDYVKKKKVKFDSVCDNISILKMEYGIWKIHKTFYLRK
jgi:2'-5' RNA ligase